MNTKGWKGKRKKQGWWSRNRDSSRVRKCPGTKLYSPGSNVMTGRVEVEVDPAQAHPSSRKDARPFQ